MSRKLKILIAEDTEDLLEVLSFIIESNMECTLFTAKNGAEAIQILKLQAELDLIVSDFNMPMGNGEDVHKQAQILHKNTPFILLSGNYLEDHPYFKTQKNIDHALKPFSTEELIAKMKSKLKKVEEVSPTSYIPIPISLLRKMVRIHTPLYIKINEAKYVKLTQQESTFTEQEFVKFSQKGADCLYVESLKAEEFISEYRKFVISETAWQQCSENQMQDIIKGHAELFRNFADKLAIDAATAESVSNSVNTALYLLNLNNNFKNLIKQFNKIEKYGYGDHCLILSLVSCQLLKWIPIKDKQKHERTLVLASLIHDMTLPDYIYQKKTQYLKWIYTKQNQTTKEYKEVFLHTERTKELCQRSELLPSEIEEVIFSHHELPDGTGFPMGKKNNQILEIGLLFIISEKIVDHFIEHFGSKNLSEIIDEIKPLFNDPKSTEWLKIIEKELV